MRGRLITIEGLDGAGKSTLAGTLADELRRWGPRVSVLREPGGVPAGERVRELISDPHLNLDHRAEALLFAASRAQLVAEGVVPLLEAGTWVLLDRFVDSSLAYQGAGRGLGVEELRAVNRFATGGLEPDRTLLLRIDPAGGRARLQRRGDVPDRMERESERFFATIASAYDALAAHEPARIRVIEARAAPEQVLSAALSALSDLLQGFRAGS